MEALDYFARLPGCEIKVSLDGRRTRLHAKAWIFHRKTRFGSAYVGSANLSGAALLGGLEWTKCTEQGQAGLFTRAQAHFETLWNDSEFQHYDAANPEHRSELSRALKREACDQVSATTTFFDLEPKDYQKDMLEQLTLEREHGRFRNLVVGATGTGKTVVAAFELRFCNAMGSSASNVAGTGVCFHRTIPGRCLNSTTGNITRTKEGTPSIISELSATSITTSNTAKPRV